jgi:hypothetical protein
MKEGDAVLFCICVSVYRFALGHEIVLGKCKLDFI